MLQECEHKFYRQLDQTPALTLIGKENKQISSREEILPSFTKRPSLVTGTHSFSVSLPLPRPRPRPRPLPREPPLPNPPRKLPRLSAIKLRNANRDKIILRFALRSKTARRPQKLSGDGWAKQLRRPIATGMGVRRYRSVTSRAKLTLSQMQTAKNTRAKNRFHCTHTQSVNPISRQNEKSKKSQFLGYVANRS